MSNQKVYASVKIHNQEDLFEYLNLNLNENTREDFWIEKSQEFFSSLPTGSIIKASIFRIQMKSLKLTSIQPFRKSC
jgi:hypothetical protein